MCAVSLGLMNAHPYKSIWKGAYVYTVVGWYMLSTYVVAHYNETTFHVVTRVRARHFTKKTKDYMQAHGLCTLRNVPCKVCST